MIAGSIAFAAGTLLFDVEKCRWSEEMIRFFGFSPSLLPQVLPSDEIIGQVTREASQKTGIPEGTPVVNGCADQTAASLGAGVVRPGQVTAVIGTAGVISVCSDRPLPDMRNRILCWNYCLREKWVILGIMQTAGESLNWFKEAFDPSQNVKGVSSDVFEVYRSFCGQLNLTPLTQRRVSDLISELDMLGLINATVISKGRYGRTRKIKLDINPVAFEKSKEILKKELL